MKIEPGTNEPGQLFVPTRRPVVRFVATLAAVAVVLAGLWWSGLFAARVRVNLSNSFDASSNTGVAVVVVRNQGPFPARVGTLGLATTPGGSYRTPQLRLSGLPSPQVRLGGGQSARFTVTYTVDCAGAERARNSPGGYVTPDLDVRASVRGPAGTVRSAGARSVLTGACGEPIRP